MFLRQRSQWMLIGMIGVGLFSGATMRVAVGYGTTFQKCRPNMMFCPDASICQSPGHCGVTLAHKSTTTVQLSLCMSGLPTEGCAKAVAGSDQCQWETFTPLGTIVCGATTGATGVLSANPGPCYGECK